MHEHESDPVIDDVATAQPAATPAPGNGKSGNGAIDAIPADVIELVFKGRRRAYFANPREIVESVQS
jgi:hypothetical protein